MIIDDCHFINYDFRKIFSSINIKHHADYKRIFIYADPPYLKTSNNYNKKWTLQDTEDLFENLVNTGVKFAISEFNGNKEIERLIKQYNLTKIKIKERKTLKNRNTEILICNYENDVELF